MVIRDVHGLTGLPGIGAGTRVAGQAVDALVPDRAEGVALALGHTVDVDLGAGDLDRGVVDGVVWAAQGEGQAGGERGAPEDQHAEEPALECPVGPGEHPGRPQAGAGPAGELVQEGGGRRLLLLPEGCGAEGEHEAAAGDRGAGVPGCCGEDVGERGGGDDGVAEVERAPRGAVLACEVDP
jgi:hypothetical protein